MYSSIHNELTITAKQNATKLSVIKFYILFEILEHFKIHYQFSFFFLKYIKNIHSDYLKLKNQKVFIVNLLKLIIHKAKLFRYLI